MANNKEIKNHICSHIKNSKIDIHKLTSHSDTIVVDFDEELTLFFDRAKLIELRNNINVYLEEEN